ncbi:MAG: sugar ABC transporter ATP-binding protein [Actinobacteria bacterium]|nr:sugar ABC transporter ATP-binding protein [Actinomycetota bacterium]
MSAGVGQSPVLSLQGMHKRYGGVHALRSANLTISAPGVVHILLGENGSGKSTLLGILSGQTRPDQGTMTLGGAAVDFASPVDALAKGIAMVSQETAVAPDLSVAENVLLGRGLVRRGPALSWGRTERRARAVLKRLDLDCDPRDRVGALPPDQRQMIEIARALSSEARILILDEPTSSLTDDEVEALFRVVRQLKREGVAVIFVSHRLPEVFAIGDEVTVLRDGATVAEGPIGAFDERSLVEAMVGADSAYGRGETARPAAGGTGTALTVRGMRVPGAVRDVDLEVGRGEIVGVSGLVGAGRSEMLEAIFGARAITAGTLTLGGEPFQPRSPRHSIERGLGFLPPDRKGQGLVLGLSIQTNLTMVETIGRSRAAVPRPQAEWRRVAGTCERMQVRMSSPQLPVGSLSGGNQQKIALAKWLLRDPGLLLLDEPTRGVDVAAKAEIHNHLKAIAASGVGMLVSSSENEELIELCDRILVMSRGRMVASLSQDEATEAKLVSSAGGHV